MRIVYIADDGKMFKSEYECEMYELKLKKSVDGFRIYDERGHLATNPYSEASYVLAYIVEVDDEEGLKNLHILSVLTGFCLYRDITSPGRWKYIVHNDDGLVEGRFEKEE